MTQYSFFTFFALFHCDIVIATIAMLEGLMAFFGRLVYVDGEPQLQVQRETELTNFPLERVRDGVYELVGKKKLIIDGLEVNIVITHRYMVIFYTEVFNPTEEEAEEVLIE